MYWTSWRRKPNSWWPRRDSNAHHPITVYPLRRRDRYGAVRSRPYISFAPGQLSRLCLANCCTLIIFRHRLQPIRRLFTIAFAPRLRPSSSFHSGSIQLAWLIFFPNTCIGVACWEAGQMPSMTLPTDIGVLTWLAFQSLLLRFKIPLG